MADADEDVIPRQENPGEDFDISDETQDFRFLTALASDDAKIPKRGEKDFEPHATILQSDILAASRQAMHNALSFQRVHQPKGHTLATYHPETNMAYAYNPKGVLYSRMGQVLSAKEDPFGEDGRRGQRLWLLPEEVIYLIERGSLDARWPPSPIAEGDEGDGLGLPMSLQGAYAMFIGDENNHGESLTFERYSVYSALKRLGYTVMRAPSWNSPGPPLDETPFPPMLRPPWHVGLWRPFELLARLFGRSPVTNEENQREGPVVPPGLYRSYTEIYHRLALIPYHEPSKSPRDISSETDPNFRITYHVWKPGSQTFKKSSPGTPDFRIAVINARTTSVPTLQQLSALLETTPYDPPKEDAQLYMKLRHGHKNVILAVVDQGITSYLRVADAVFGKEKLYERKGRQPGGKRGGRGGGRGRGR